VTEQDPRFALTVSAQGERSLVQVQGELDLFTAPTLGECLDEQLHQGRLRVVLDLTDTRFLDSAGMSVLVQAMHRFRKRNAVLALAAPSEGVMRIIEAMDLKGAFPTVRVA
jgi:anti-sigma B factor antagonist